MPASRRSISDLTEAKRWSADALTTPPPPPPAATTAATTAATAKGNATAATSVVDWGVMVQRAHSPTDDDLVVDPRALASVDVPTADARTASPTLEGYIIVSPPRPETPPPPYTKLPPSAVAALPVSVSSDECGECDEPLPVAMGTAHTSRTFPLPGATRLVDKVELSFDELAQQNAIMDDLSTAAP